MSNKVGKAVRIPFVIGIILVAGWAGGCQKPEPDERDLKNPNTLTNRSFRAATFYAQGRYAEAEAEYRALVTTRQRVQGPEHSDTLNTRKNLADTLYVEGKHAEAEAEYRTLLGLQMRVLGPAHSNVSGTCYTLAHVIADQGRKPEALVFARRAWEGWRNSLGEAHPQTKAAKQLVERLEQSR